MATIEGIGNVSDDLGFTTKSATTAGVAADLTRRFIDVERNKGRLNTSEGIVTDVEKATDFESYMRITGAALARRTLMNGPGGLDGTSTHPDNTYGARRYRFLLESEGIRNQAYDDKTGKPLRPGVAKQGLATIGVGFNMDRPGAFAIYRQASGLGKTEFEQVRKGARKIPNDVIRKIFDLNVRDAESVVSSRFRGVNLTEHQRLALVSLAFNSPSLFGPNIVRMVKSGDFKGVGNHILTALNKSGNVGLQMRRYREAQMFIGAANPGLTSFKKYSETLEKK